MPSVLDPEHLLRGEDVRVLGRTPSFATAPLDESTTPVSEPVEIRRITAILEDEYQVHAEGGEAPTNEGIPSWKSRLGSPVLGVIDRVKPEVFLTNHQPGPPVIVTNPELHPLDPGFIQDVKYVLGSKGVSTRVTIAAEVIKRKTHVSPKNFDRLLRESVHEALVRGFNPDAQSN